MTTKAKTRKAAVKAAPVTLAASIAQHKAAIAAIEAVYDSVGESDEFTESVNYEDELCGVLALIPCATDAEFLEKLRWLFARDVARYYEPSFEEDNYGGTLVAIAQHFGIASHEDAEGIIGAPASGKNKSRARAGYTSSLDIRSFHLGT